METDPPDKTSEGQPPVALPAAPRIVRSEELLAGAVEVCIQHNGELYRLRHTRSGKLILYK